MNAVHIRDEINPFASALCGPYAELAVKDYRLRLLLARVDVAVAGAAPKNLAV
jgi:hypothetical protein